MPEVPLPPSHWDAAPHSCLLYPPPYTHWHAASYILVDLELFSNLNNSVVSTLHHFHLSQAGVVPHFPYCPPVPGSLHCLPPSAKSWHQPKVAGNFPLFRLQFRSAALSRSMGRWPACHGHGGGRCSPSPRQEWPFRRTLAGDAPSPGQSCTASVSVGSWGHRPAVIRLSRDVKNTAGTAF